MIDAKVLLAVLFVHWLGDFVLQNGWMAQGKSKKMLPLLAHVGAYTATLFLLLPVLGLTKTVIFALVNGVAHGAIDFCTSRLNVRLWEAKRVHGFFVSVGYDQLMHGALIVATMEAIA
jgi:Protein of unknown function (DUF3307)